MKQNIALKILIDPINIKSYEEYLLSSIREKQYQESSQIAKIINFKSELSKDLVDKINFNWKEKRFTEALCILFKANSYGSDYQIHAAIGRILMEQIFLEKRPYSEALFPLNGVPRQWIFDDEIHRFERQAFEHPTRELENALSLSRKASLQDETILESLAYCYFCSGRFKDAIHVAKQAKDNLHATATLGYSYYNAGQYKNAAKTFSDFNHKTGLYRDWSVLYFQGKSYLKLEKFSKAITAFETSAALYERSKTYTHLACAHNSIGSHRAAALACWKSYLMSQTHSNALNLAENLIVSLTDNSLKTLINSFIKKNNVDFRKSDIKIILTQIMSYKQIDSLVFRAISALCNKYSSDNKSLESDQIKKINKSIIPKSKWPQKNSSIIVFGSSHAKIYKEISWVDKVYSHSGASIWDMIAPDKYRQTNYKELLLEIAIKERHNGNILLLELGEVDVRDWIHRYSIRNNKTIFETADLFLNNYIEFARYLTSLGFKVVISGPHGGGCKETTTYATQEDRNNLALYINSSLNYLCAKNRIKFITLFDIVVNPITLRERQYLFGDEIHLMLPPTPIGRFLSFMAGERLRLASEGDYSTNINFPEVAELKLKLLFTSDDMPKNQEYISSRAFETPWRINKDEKGNLYLLEFPCSINISWISLNFQELSHDTHTKCTAINDDNIHSKLVHSRNPFIENGSHRHSFEKPKGLTNSVKYILIEIRKNDDGIAKLASIDIKRFVRQQNPS